MDQLVTCSGIDCSTCSLLEMVSGIFSWLIGISSVVAIAFLTIGGFIYISSFSDKEKIEKAKKTLFYSVVGFSIALVSFLVVVIIFKISGVSKNQNWWSLNCEVDQSEPSAKKSRSNFTQKSFNLKSVNEIEDSAPVIKGIAGLNEIVSDGKKIGIFDLEKMNAENLRQDLLSLFSGESFRLLSADPSLNDKEISDFTLLDNGFLENLSDPKKKDLQDKISKIIDFRKDDGDLTITDPNTGESQTLWWSDPKIKEKLEKIIENASKKNQKIVAYKNSRGTGSLNSCIDSEGDFREFKNECEARKNTCGNEDLECSDVDHPAMGCECPSNMCSLNGKCISRNTFENVKNPEEENDEESPDETNDEDSDEVTDDLDNCEDTPLDENANQDRNSSYFGCSCSQINLPYRACPADRCEGTNWVDYPSSGKDTCSDGEVTKHSCSPFLSSGYSSRCDEKEPFEEDKNRKEDPSDWNDRKSGDKSPDNWGKNDDGGGSNGGTGGSGDTGGTGNTGGEDKTGGKRDPDSDQTPPDKGPGNFNPTPSFKELAECIGFKDGKIPYNGVLVVLLNEDDPTNAKHPNNNASRMFYLTREGKVIGNAGDPNGAGLKIGPWTKGSGGTSWSPGWSIIPNAQGMHYGSSGGDRWSFRSGDGHRVGPKGEKMNHNGTLNPSGGKVQNMSGCNMHSGSRRSHSRGCMTMGGTERKAFTETVKRMATQENGKVLTARLTAKNTDNNSQKILSDYCGNMDPYKAVDQFKTLSQYRNYDPFKGYGPSDSRKTGN